MLKAISILKATMIKGKWNCTELWMDLPALPFDLLKLWFYSKSYTVLKADDVNYVCKRGKSDRTACRINQKVVYRKHFSTACCL